MVTQLHRAAQPRRARPRSGLLARLVMGGGAILALCLIAAVIAAIVYMLWDDHSLTSRPLVLIHSPINRQRLSEGDSVLVHTTARSPAGIQRVELWADDVLIAQRQAEPGAPSDSMVLSADWIPLNTGSHRLIARATSVDKVDGQASIMIETTETDEAEATRTHTVQEGETLDTIAGAYGTTPDDLAALNPGIDPGNLAPGSEVVVPGDEPSAEGESPGDSPLPTDSDPPSAMAEPPGGMFSRPLDRPNPLSDEPTGLRVELLLLRTGVPYESLSCYIGMAGATPRRYPDADNDQTTDESFTLIGTTGTSWNVGEYLGGDSMPMILWPANQPIPFSISCVGISGGGTQALQLGSTELAIPPGQWDGIVRRIEVVGPEGSFTISYQVTGIDSEPRGEPKWLDPNMTPPTDLAATNYNVFLGPEPSDDGSPTNFVATEDDPWALLWHYRPPMGAEIPDGFRIYINGTLQWTERADRRSGDWHYTVFPPQWRHPPCGTQYVLTVSTWRSDPSDPEGVESRTANPPVVFETPPGECDRHVIISFDTLEIFNLGGDDDHDPGSVGPPYGTFFANDQQVTFDSGNIIPPGQGWINPPQDMFSNTLYSLTDSSVRRGLGFDGQPHFVVDVPDGEVLEIGYHIMDEDRGRCEEPSDIGCDDHICEGSVALNGFNNTGEGTVDSTNGVCRANYTYWLSSDSPVDSVGDTTPPLPWLEVEGVEVDDDGNVHVHVHNTGPADWAMHDLTVELQRHTGEYLDRYTWPDFSLARDERAVLRNPDMHIESPYEVCVVVDPDNAVQEEYDGTLTHDPVCSPRTDLEITDVTFEGDRSGQLRVTVQNTGTEPVVDRNILVHVYYRLTSGPSGDLYGEAPASLEVGDAVTISIPVPEDIRAGMLNGYIVVVNEGNWIDETDMTNNTYTAGPAQQLRLSWCSKSVSHVAGTTSSARMSLATSIRSGTGTSYGPTTSASWSHSLTEAEVSQGDNHVDGACSVVSELSLPVDQYLYVNVNVLYAIDDGDYEPIGSGDLLLRFDELQFDSSDYADQSIRGRFTLQETTGDWWTSLNIQLLEP